MKTPFEMAGYDETTRFRALVGNYEIRPGDVVKIYEDDESECPIFTTEDSMLGYMFLPGLGMKEELKVINEESPTIIDIAKTLDACEIHEALSENFEELSIVDLRAAVVGLARLLEEKGREIAMLREDLNELKGQLK